MKHQSQIACEIRALQLPLERASFDRLMEDASWGSNAIAVIQGVRQKTDPEGLERWVEFVSKAKQTLVDHGLPDKNWGAGRNIDASAWMAFGDKIEELRVALIPAPKKRLQP